MTRIYRLHVVQLLLSILLSGARLQAASSSAGRGGHEMVGQLGQSIVSITAIVVNQTPAGDRESRIEITGTVIADSGLTVTSLSAIDPNIHSNAMRAMMDQGSGSKSRIFESTLKEVKLRFSDGREVVANVVGRDAERDLAFLAPAEKSLAEKRTFLAVKIETAAEASLLDSCYIVARLPGILQHATLVQPSTVTAIIPGRVKTLIVNDAIAGWAVFNAAGNLIGITVQRIAPGFRTPVIMPTVEVIQSAKQVTLVTAPRPGASTPGSEG